MANKYKTNKAEAYKKPVSKGVFPDETDELESILGENDEKSEKYLPKSEDI